MVSNSLSFAEFRMFRALGMEELMESPICVTDLYDIAVGACFSSDRRALPSIHCGVASLL